MKLIKWINASAGTGKTTYILNDIKSLIDAGVNPGSILCLSFTKKTASEMYVRYSQDKEDHPVFSTIHAFASSINKTKMQIVSDDKILTEIIKEAIEMTLDNIWIDFFKSVDIYDFTNIIDDIKLIINNRRMSDDDLALYNMINLDINSNLQITLSESAKKDLKNQGLNNLKNKILSNDISIYLNSIVTKEMQINKTLIPASFLNNLEYKNTVKEVQNVLKSILMLCVNGQNNIYIKQSAIFNLFVKKVYLNYLKIKEMNKLFDYNDLITDYNNIIIEKIMQIKHIFIDEAQDLSLLQWNFLMSIFQELFQQDSFSLCIVGDEKQIIYEFQGAMPEIYENVKNKLSQICPDNDILWYNENLNKSYRSAEGIISFVNSIMRHTKCATKQISANDKASYIKTWMPIVVNETVSNSAIKWKITPVQVTPANVELCINEIKRLKDTKLLNHDRYVKYSDIMIIIPRRSILSFLLFNELNKANIPIKESPFYINQDDIMEEFIMIGDFVLAQDSDIAVASILKGPFFQWSNDDIEDICCSRTVSIWEEMHNRAIAVLNQINTRDNAMIESIADIKKEWIDEKSLKTVEAYQEMSSWLSLSKDVVGFFGGLFFHTKYGEILRTIASHEVTIFWEKVVEFSSSSLSLFGFIQSMYHSQHVFAKNIDGITICTIHSAKGRESEIVFLFNSNNNLVNTGSGNIFYKDMMLLKGHYKLYNQAKNESLFTQEMQSDRLLYVALTRAKEQLYIIPPTDLENITSKSGYFKILQNINLFECNENQEYEIFDKYEKKIQKYN